MTSTWGDFVIQEEIGRGSFGRVFKAWHPTLRQAVALKLIPVVPGNDKEIERALDESRRLASVRHHNVVTVHDARYADGHVGICMEMVTGESLSQVVERQGRMGPDEVLACAVTLCNALSAIHGAQVVHNDVKAQNVMREDGGRLVLMDFGAGRRLPEPDRTTGLYFAGTPVYMAPEIFQFQEPSPVSDIYSLGVLLFYLLTKTYPVRGGTMEEIARAHARGQRHYLGDLRSDLPERLLGVVDRALEPQPADRYRSSGEMLHDLTSERGRRRAAPVLPASLPGVDAADPPAYGAPRSTPAGRAVRESMATVGIVLAVLVPVVWIIGFLGTRAHRVMFGITDQFDRATPLDWLIAGLQTLPLPVFTMLVALTACLVLAFAWRVTTRVSLRASTWSSATLRRLSSASGRAGLDDPTMAGTLVLLVQIGLLLAVYWNFSGLITAITTPLVNGPVPDHARLDPAREYEGWLRFCMVVSAIAFGSAVTWGWFARRRAGQGGAAVLAAGVALTALFVGMATVPWRVVNRAQFPVAAYDGEHCYVIHGDLPDVLLLCPWRAAGRSVNVRREALERPRISENVFSAVAARLRNEGGT